MLWKGGISPCGERFPWLKPHLSLYLFNISKNYTKYQSFVDILAVAAFLAQLLVFHARMQSCTWEEERASAWNCSQQVCAGSWVGRSGFLKAELLLWHHLNKATGKICRAELYWTCLAHRQCSCCPRRFPLSSLIANYLSQTDFLNKSPQQMAETGESLLLKWYQRLTLWEVSAVGTAQQKQGALVGLNAWRELGFISS